MGRPKGSKNKPKDALNQSRTINLSEKSKKLSERPVKGSQCSVCTKCGNKFEQDFKPEINAYTDFKICPECRQREVYDKQKQMEQNGSTVYNAILQYHPFPAQQEMHEAFENHRFLVLSCIIPGQMVQGANKPIESVQVGNYIISHKSRSSLVERTMKKPYSGNVCEIKTGLTLPLTVTEEHPVLFCAAKREKKNNKSIYYKLKEAFIPVKNIANAIKRPNYKEDGVYCFIKIPRIKGNKETPSLTSDIAFLAGLFFLSGRYCEGFSEISIPKNSFETQEKLDEIMDSCGFMYDKYTEGKCLKYNVYSDELTAEFWSLFGSKKEHCDSGIPVQILHNANDDVVLSFLQGLYQGCNGRTHCSRKGLVFRTQNYSLATDIQLALTRLAIVSSLRYVDDSQNNFTYIVYIRDTPSALKLGFEQDFTKCHTSARFFTEDGLYVAITSINTKKYKGNVYDLTTTDHSFSVNNVVVHNCGNRTGKDRFSNMAGIMYFVECLNENRHLDNPELVPSVYWWIIAPTEPMAQQNWLEINRFFPKDWVISKSNSTMTLYTIGGGMIEVRSAYNPESLVGVGLDLVTITEAARIQDLQTVWANLEARLSSPGRGREKDRVGKKYGVGKAIINSSPIGRNYFYNMWTWGQPNHDEYSSDWVSFQLPWTVNPANAEKAKEIIHTRYGDITYEESLRRRIGDRMYRQNFLADFLAGSGEVFKDFKEKCCVDIFSPKFQFDHVKRMEYIKEWKKPVPGRRYRISWDIATGSSEDSPVLMIRDMSNNNIVNLIDLYGKDYEMQYDTIAYWSKYYNGAECVYSSTGHTACVGQLLKRGVYEIEIQEQGGKKAMYVQNAETAVQNGDVHLLMDGSVEAQTALAQIMDYTEKDGKYSNNAEPHDDWASALYINYYDYQVQSAKMPFLGMFDFI